MPPPSCRPSPPCRSCWAGTSPPTSMTRRGCWRPLTPGERGDRPFASVLLRSETAASSQIENLTSSARALAEAEIGEGSRANAAVILANVRTMQAALDLAGRLDEDAVLAMHRALMSQQSVHAPGGGATSRCGWWLPPAPRRRALRAAVADDVAGHGGSRAFIDRDDLPPLAQAALAHAQFETIHPFTDGNGRTGGPCCTRCCATGDPPGDRADLGGLLALVTTTSRRWPPIAPAMRSRSCAAWPRRRAAAPTSASASSRPCVACATTGPTRLTATSRLRVLGPARPPPAPARRHGTRRRP